MLIPSASGGCPAIPVTTLVIINSVPTATISYSSNPFCTSEVPAITITGLTGGPFTGTISALRLDLLLILPPGLLLRDPVHLELIR